jgi:predicted nucleic acid-binding protein
MIILDTSVWIEFLRGNDSYRSALRSLLENRQIIGLEWVFGELLQGAKNSRERSIIVSYWENLPGIDTTGVWVEAGMLSADGNLTSKGVGLIDCAIIIAARRAGAKIWSLDNKLNALLGKNEKYEFELNK